MKNFEFEITNRQLFFSRFSSSLLNTAARVHSKVKKLVAIQKLHDKVIVLTIRRIFLLVCSLSVVNDLVSFETVFVRINVITNIYE